MSTTGSLDKMKVELADDGRVSYALPLDDERIPLNPLLGQRITLEFGSEILCTNCGRKTKKSFSQGYCFPCARKLACCDMCIVKPELCHYDAGTCREPEWGVKHCMIPHTIYLANSSGVKVGITRAHQRRTRWVDQGAIQALPILTVQRRLDAGLVEVAIAKHVADKTNYRKMLKNEVEPADLVARRDELLAHVPGGIEVEAVTDEAVTEIHYPVLSYPTKIVSHNFDKQPRVEGTLQGIKGQYLILDTGVLNIRKFTGYRISFDAAQPTAAPPSRGM